MKNNVETKSPISRHVVSSRDLKTAQKIARASACLMQRNQEAYKELANK